MKKNVFAIGAICCFVLLSGLLCSAQEFATVYPTDGATIRFQDLTSQGFQWQAPPDAGPFGVRLFAPHPFIFLSSVLFESESSPWILDATQGLHLGSYFTEGSEFQWRVEEIDQDGNTISTSNQSGFKVSNQTTMIPSPTPQVWPTPPGDIDGSSKVDARDLFILSSAWVNANGNLRAGDLNQDSMINWKDLLIYNERYGDPAPTPTPAPPIGIPQNVLIIPNEVVTMSEVPDLTIQWSPPQYPHNGQILYDLLIAPPNKGQYLEFNGLTETIYKPFSSYDTRFNEPFNVFIRARVNGMGESNIAVSSFTIIQNALDTPTPTPVPQTPDISSNSVTDILDVALFTKAFGTYKAHVQFNSLADLHTDEKIDRLDLLLFQQYYAKRGQTITAPQWLKADIPVIDGPVLEPPSEFITYELNEPYKLSMGVSGNQNGLVEALYTRLHFSPVDGSIDYFVTMDYQNRGIHLEFFTGGATYFEQKMIPMGHNEIISIMVQAAGEGLQLGEKSETLHVIIPAN